MSDSDPPKNLHPEAADYSHAGLKTTWGAGPGPKIETMTPVVRPTKQQLAVFGNAEAKVCGGCQHFRPDAFKSEAKRTQFFRELVQGYQWKLEHLCDPPNELGLCHMRDGTICGPRTAACDQWAPKRK